MVAQVQTRACRWPAGLQWCEWAASELRRYLGRRDALCVLAAIETEPVAGGACAQLR